MATTLYPPLRIRDIPGPQPGQFGLVSRILRKFHFIFTYLFSLRNLIDLIKIL